MNERLTDEQEKELERLTSKLQSELGDHNSFASEFRILWAFAREVYRLATERAAKIAETTPIVGELHSKIAAAIRGERYQSGDSVPDMRMSTDEYLNLTSETIHAMFLHQLITKRLEEVFRAAGGEQR